MFSHVQPYAGDPILGLMEKFAKDSRAKKVNLGVGIYYDEEGRVRGAIAATMSRI